MSGGGSSGSSSRADQESGASAAQKKFKGVRRRKWGKWVSEIRVPGKQERLWLGSYSTPEAAAVAHDIASVRDDMSPKSVQKAASDAGMAIDAQIIRNRVPENEVRFGTGSGTVNHGLCEYLQVVIMAMIGMETILE
ncbi:ETHYLENE-RESPONSIVE TRANSCRIPTION FACTOR ERF042-RELATED [Salix koriyanagi]|uniref:ETHYLENE-RESPONSIVE TRANSCRIPTION FACTOR ERF042-RELATED n=1 Tax=Salix koriyanagi TaxID=2511006 RepID=A0A9Q0VZV3_9ROSI|nr:ETHYLENE-RESPONSIVE TRANSCRIPTION FACTOR ERF042-RELATED [Salix koriyanagi]